MSQTHIRGTKAAPITKRSPLLAALVAVAILMIAVLSAVQELPHFADREGSPDVLATRQPQHEDNAHWLLN